MHTRLKIFFSFLLFNYSFLIFNCAFSQSITFEKWYSDSSAVVGYCVQQTQDGGYIVTGRRSLPCFGCNDLVLLKLDELGNELWMKVYGSSVGDDAGNYVRQTSDSGYIVTGYTDISGAGKDKIYLLKTNSLGDTLWTKNFGGTNIAEANSVQQTTDGGYIIAGFIFKVTDGDVYLIKTNSNGDTLWTRMYGKTNDDVGQSVLQTSEGGYIICGYTYTSNNGDEFYLIRTKTNGDTLWTKTWGGIGGDRLMEIQKTVDGNFIVAGSTTSYGAGDWDCYLAKTDTAGNILWSKTYGNTNENTASSVKPTVDGGYIIAGSTAVPTANGYNVYAVKTNGIGDTLFTKQFSGLGEGDGYFVSQTTDGGFVISGSTKNQIPIFGIYVIKTDSSGNILTGVSEIETATNNILLFPNPTTGIFAVAADFLIQGVELYDMYGRKVFEQNKIKKEKTEINISNLPDNIYFIKIISQNKIYNHSIIKLK